MEEVCGLWDKSKYTSNSGFFLKTLMISPQILGNQNRSRKFQQHPRQYSEDHNFLRSMGWHPHEQTEEDEKLRLNRQASSRSQLGDVASARDCLEDEEDEEEVNPKDFLTLTEYVRKKGMPDLQQRRTESGWMVTL